MRPGTTLLCWLALALTPLVPSCKDTGAELPLRTTGGDAERGRAALRHYQCGVCHRIPGVTGARGLVGPPLTAYGRRVYLAGKLPQEPGLLVRWIQDAPSLVPGTAMPNVGVTEADARHIAAYLYRLR
jgi:cytochrome c